jgi:aspartyl aminopeptidase
VCVQLKIHQRVGEGESKSKYVGCRACNAQTIFDVNGAKTKGVKALIAHANSPKAKLRPNPHKEDTTRAKTKRNKVANKPSPKRKSPQTHASQEKCYA